jgi:hypothetical protein
VGVGAVNGSEIFSVAVGQQRLNVIYKVTKVPLCRYFGDDKDIS